jgi:hypothetical protein
MTTCGEGQGQLRDNVATLHSTIATKSANQEAVPLLPTMPLVMPNRSQLPTNATAQSVVLIGHFGIPLNPFRMWSDRRNLPALPSAKILLPLAHHASGACPWLRRHRAGTVLLCAQTDAGAFVVPI